MQRALLLLVRELYWHSKIQQQFDRIRAVLFSGLEDRAEDFRNSGCAAADSHGALAIRLKAAATNESSSSSETTLRTAP